MGGGTRLAFDYVQRQRISIHPPRGGRDYIYGNWYYHEQDFNPPAPWGAGQLLAILRGIKE